MSNMIDGKTVDFILQGSTEATIYFKDGSVITFVAYHEPDCDAKARLRVDYPQAISESERKLIRESTKNEEVQRLPENENGDEFHG